MTLNQVETITLSAYVNVPIQLFEQNRFPPGKKNRLRRETVEVKEGWKKPLKIEPVEFNLSNRLSYEIVEVKPGSFTRSTSRASKHRRFFSGILRLKTNYPEKPEIRIYLRGRFGT